MKIEGIVFENEVVVEEKTLKEGGVSVQVEELFNSTTTPDDYKVWVFSVKQENVPNWFDAEDSEKRFRHAIGAWWTKHVLEGKEIEELNSGLYRLEKCRVKRLCGDVRAILYDTKIEEMHDNARIIEMGGDAHIETMCDNSKIDDMSDDTTVGCMMDYSCVEYASEFVVVSEMHENAYIKWLDDYAKVKFMHDNACVGSMNDDSNVEFMSDNSCIRIMKGKSYVHTVYDGKINEMQDHASVMNFAGEINCIGKIKDCAIVRAGRLRDNKKMKILTSESAEIDVITK